MLTFKEYQQLVEYHDWATTRQKPVRNYNRIERLGRLAQSLAAGAALAVGTYAATHPEPQQKVSFADKPRTVTPMTDAARQDAFDVLSKEMTPQQRHEDAIKRQKKSDVREVEDEVKPAPAVKPKQPVKPAAPTKSKQPVKHKK
jgi:hypothetical protein